MINDRYWYVETPFSLVELGTGLAQYYSITASQYSCRSSLSTGGVVHINLDIYMLGTAHQAISANHA